MDKLKKTTIETFCKYYNMTSRFGIIKQKDRIRLLILYFLYYLKFDSDYVFEINTDDTFSYHLNDVNINKINLKFLEIFECLSNKSCLIHENKNCFNDLFLFTPPAYTTDPYEHEQALVTNANGLYSYNDIYNSLNLLAKYIITNDDEKYIIENDSTTE